jgi:cell division protein FtsZ
LINRDFADIRAAMVGMGYAMMGTAIGRGENAAADAAQQAINCPLLEETSIAGARSVLINITASSQLGLHDVDAACAIIREATQCEDVQLNFGVTLNEAMGDTVKITVIATGFHAETGSGTQLEAPEIRIQARPPETAPLPVPTSTPTPFFEPEPVMQLEPEIEPEPVMVAEPEPILDMDDLDTPAYLRQGRLLN